MNEAVSPQLPQGPQAPYVEGDIPNVEIKNAFQTLSQLMMTQAQVITTHAQAMTAQANQGVGPQVNPHTSTPACRIRDFMRMNPSTLYGTKVDEDSHSRWYMLWE